MRAIASQKRSVVEACSSASTGVSRRVPMRFRIVASLNAKRAPALGKGALLARSRVSNSRSLPADKNGTSRRAKIGHIER